MCPLLTKIRGYWLRFFNMNRRENALNKTSHVEITKMPSSVTSSLSLHLSTSNTTQSPTPTPSPIVSHTSRSWFSQQCNPFSNLHPNPDSHTPRELKINYWYLDWGENEIKGLKKVWVEIRELKFGIGEQRKRTRKNCNENIYKENKERNRSLELIFEIFGRSSLLWYASSSSSSMESWRRPLGVGEAMSFIDSFSSWHFPTTFTVMIWRRGSSGWKLKWTY